MRLTYESGTALLPAPKTSTGTKWALYGNLILHSLKTAASYSPVRLMYDEKNESKQ